LAPITLEDIRREQFHSIKFYDRNNDLLQEVLSQNASRSVHAPLAQISPYFSNAMLAAEDRNFHSHSGVDFAAVGRAVIQNLKAGSVVSGASTITLQLARLLHPAERTLFNKFKETFRAFRLEAGLSKSGILEAYINRLPMSGNLYGVESAARTYLGVSSGDLNLAQSSFLAAIPNSPTRYNPYHNFPNIKKRQKTILQRMAASGMIAASRVAGALKENIFLKPQIASFKAPHLVFQLLNSLPDSVQNVRTTIDPQLQKIVSGRITKTLNGLKHLNVTNAAALLLDNQSGEVLAYVGSADYFNNEIDGQVDGVAALRQPGSALKPFLYLLAMENGFTAATLLSDIPTHYAMPAGVYSPRNYSESFHGPVRLREALANSFNVPAVRTLAKIGVRPFLQRLREYGFHSLSKSAEFYGVGLALGGGEVRLSELTRAYMRLANLGHFLPFKAAQGANGYLLKQGFTGNIGSERLNFLIGDILGDSRARTSEFGFDSILNLPFKCSVKTGTSYRFSDNWTVGFTEDYTLGVWVGNFDHSPMLKVSGVTGAGPIFANIMYALYNNKDKPVRGEPPEGLIRKSICPASGKEPTSACPAQIQEYFQEKESGEYQKQVCAMHQIKQDKMTTVFPVKFRKWASPLGFESEKFASDAAPEMTILSPRDGAEYARLSNLAPEYQSIHFEIDTMNPSKTIEWRLNEKLVAVTTNQHDFLWQIKPGAYHLLATDVAAKKKARVQFKVK